MRENNRLRRRRVRLDTVGVVGSIPIARTIQNQGIIEIPSEYQVVPAVECRGGRFRFFRALIPKKTKRREKGVKSARPKRGIRAASRRGSHG